MQWESRHELNAFRLLDCDPSVIRFTEQPCEIVYLQDGVQKRHFPDILVEFAGRKELWEVKPVSEINRHDLTTRTAALDGLTRWGYDYRVVLGSDLASEPRIKNVIRILRFSSTCSVICCGA